MKTFQEMSVVARAANYVRGTYCASDGSMQMNGLIAIAVKYAFVPYFCG
jgi:hypothetical protein